MDYKGLPFDPLEHPYAAYPTQSNEFIASIQSHPTTHLTIIPHIVIIITTNKMEHMLFDLSPSRFNVFLRIPLVAWDKRNTR